MTALTATSRGFLEHLRIALRLTARNRMALVYGYGFPLFFLLSFLVLYRLDDPPLIRHMGELLTIGALGGACFGLPTSLVGDRERGVLRRFRLTPMPAGALLTGTLIARYLVVLSAALCQLGLSMAIGRWLPAHPIGLLVACSFVIFALLGLGLVLAAMADTVPAVQALGQCIFLPMLILGGVAVKLEALPAWVLPLSAFIPGRYAVEAIQACTNGDGLTATRFQLVALLTIGAAACVAGVGCFDGTAASDSRPFPTSRGSRLRLRRGSSSVRSPFDAANCCRNARELPRRSERRQPRLRPLHHR